MAAAPGGITRRLVHALERARASSVYEMGKSPASAAS
jgi:hypothetical protein